MPKLVCVQCEVEYKIVKTGNYVIEMFLNPPEPYKIQNGDRWQCPNCKHQIIAGFGELPLAEHYQDNFQNILEKVQNQEYTINCFER